MLIGAVITRIMTGKDPKETKDYFFPPTGRLTKYGTPERISMPSYTKDLYEYGTQPGTTILNKANPIFGIIGSIIKNEDFFGNGIRNTDDSALEQTWQSLLYGARQVVPFSIQGTKQFIGGGDLDEKGKVLSTMPYVGFTPAPARVTSPEQMDAYQHRERHFQRTPQPQCVQRQAVVHREGGIEDEPADRGGPGLVDDLEHPVHELD